MNPNISPNQFAFKGMAKYAHPLAKAVRKGITFRESTSIAPTAREDMDDPRGPTYRVPRSFNPDVTEHSLLAVAPRAPGRPQETVEGTPGRLAGELHWRGNAWSWSPRRSAYPGEITYVARGTHATEDLYRDPEEGIWKSRNPLPKTPGLMTSMFHFAHEYVAPGQTTVPVHSPERSAEGEAWSAKVGPEHLRPPRYDESWRPPLGVHPYEKKDRPEPAREYRIDTIGPTRQGQFFDATKYEPDPF